MKPKTTRRKQARYLGMTLPQLIIVSGLAVLLVMTMGAGGLILLATLNEPPVIETRNVTPVVVGQVAVQTQGSSGLAFPTLPASWTPTFTSTASQTPLPTATFTITPSRTPRPSITPLPTRTTQSSSTPRPTLEVPTLTSVPTQGIAPTTGDGSGFQYLYSYVGKDTIVGKAKTFGNGTLRLKWQYSDGANNSYDRFVIVLQRQYDDEIFQLVQEKGLLANSGVTDFVIPGAGDYKFVIDSLATWEVDVFFENGG